MTGKLEFTDTVPGNKDAVLAFLAEQGMYEVTHDIDPEEGFDHYDFEFAVDTDGDLRGVLAVMLFYNDFSREDAVQRARALNLNGSRESVGK